MGSQRKISAEIIEQSVVCILGLNKNLYNGLYKLANKMAQLAKIEIDSKIIFMRIFKGKDSLKMCYYISPFLQIQKNM